MNSIAEVSAAAETAKKAGRANVTIGVLSGGRPGYRTLKVDG